MIRLILSIIVVAVIITFVILPLMKYIRRGIKSGGEQIEKAFTEEIESPKNESQKRTNAKQSSTNQEKGREMNESKSD